MKRQRSTGQSTVEYALLIAVVVGGLVAMQIFLRNAVEGQVKKSGEQIGEQWDANQGTYRKVVDSGSHRNEITTAQGITTTDIQDENQHQEIDEQINRSDALFQ